MRIKLRDLWKLKPFDETEDRTRSGAIYAKSYFFTTLILLNGILSIVAFVLALQGNSACLKVVAVGCAINALMAGIEWHAGLKARAMNQLFIAVFTVGAVTLANSVGIS